METVQATHEFQIYGEHVIFTHLVPSGRYMVVEIVSLEIQEALRPYVDSRTQELSDLFDDLYFDGAGYRFDPQDGAPVKLLLEVENEGGQTTRIVVFDGLMADVYHIPLPR